MSALLIRAPNHLGDLVMALPAIAAAGPADVQVVRFLAPLLRMANVRGRVLPLDRGGAGFVRAVRDVRRGRYRRGVLLPPSLGSAAILALGGVPERRGGATDGRAPLLTDPVPPAALGAMHRASAYWLLARGEPPTLPPTPELTPDAAARDEWARVGGELRPPVVGIFPGSNAPSRRWAPDRFAAVARALADRGASVVVFGGPAERPLTAAVAGSWALDAGGRTSLAALAAGLASCALLVTNDTGPQHLAAAVGTPVVALWGAGDPSATAPPLEPYVAVRHTLLRHAELPCVPCVKNVCPRRGRGYFLDDAHNECMRLITPTEVIAAADRGLAAAADRPPRPVA